MRKKKSLYAFVITIILSLLILSGCGEEVPNTDITAFYKDSESSGTFQYNTKTGVDMSAKVKITGYLIGERLPGMNDVLEKLNEKLLNDINATMEINYIRWGDLQSKYALVRAS